MFPFFNDPAFYRGLAMYIIIINEGISDYIYLASTLFIICIGYNYFCIYEKKMNISSKKEREKKITAGSAYTAAK